MDTPIPEKAQSVCKTVLNQPRLLEVKGLSVRLETAQASFDAVHDVSFAVDNGKVLCLVGESGCGKSLTALALLRLIPAVGRIEASSILFEGQDLNLYSEKHMRTVRGRKMGMIFQEPMTSLNPVLRVGEQVAEPLVEHLHMPRKAAMERVLELFRQVGIPGGDVRVRDYPHQLSGGMRQRVMIAMALACEPRLLLADEPTTALDVTIQGQILVLLKELAVQRGMGLLLITHDLGVVAEMADHVGVMYAGRMVEQAPVQALFAAPLHPYTQGLMRSAPTLERLAAAKGERGRLAAIAGTVPFAGQLPEGCPFRPRCDKAFERCLQTPPEVESRMGCGEGETRTVQCWLHVKRA